MRSIVIVLTIVLIASACRKDNNPQSVPQLTKVPAVCPWFPVAREAVYVYWIGNGKSLTNKTINASCTDSSITINDITFSQRDNNKLLVTYKEWQNSMLMHKDVHGDTAWLDTVIAGYRYKAYQIAKVKTLQFPNDTYTVRYAFIKKQSISSDTGYAIQLEYADSIGVVQVVNSQLHIAGQDLVYTLNETSQK